MIEPGFIIAGVIVIGIVVAVILKFRKDNKKEVPVVVPQPDPVSYPDPNTQVAAFIKGEVIPILTSEYPIYNYSHTVDSETGNITVTAVVTMFKGVVVPIGFLNETLNSQLPYMQITRVKVLTIKVT